MLISHVGDNNTVCAFITLTQLFLHTGVNHKDDFFFFGLEGKWIHFPSDYWFFLIFPGLLGD